MSGGSMDYLFTREAPYGDEDLDHLAQCAEIVNQAASDSTDALRFKRRVDKVKECAQRMKDFAETYRELLQACEWYDSGDWDLDRVAKVLAKVGSAKSGVRTDAKA